MERTQVQLEMHGSSKAVSAMLVASQGKQYGKPIVIDELETKTDRRDPDVVVVSMRISAIQLHATGTLQDLE